MAGRKFAFVQKCLYNKDIKRPLDASNYHGGYFQMAVPKFDPKELQETGRVPGMMGNPDVIVYSFPVTAKEGYKRCTGKSRYGRSRRWR
jgi:hypothetical protein